jgi:4-hydroxyproline epimerase
MSLAPIRVIDSHTGGEPTRVVIDGFPALKGATVADRRDHFAREFDHLRTGIVREPRGSDVWVGALLGEPSQPSADVSVIFFNDAGYLGMCGHGTIGLLETLHHLGRLPGGQVALETPVGTVQAHRDATGLVTIENVASYLHQRDVTVTTSAGTFTGDVAYGGNWFFLVYDQPYALVVRDQEHLMAVTKAIRAQLAAQGVTGPHGEMIDHVELFSEPQSTEAHSRNFVLCPGNAYDRSPCGTGTSAKLAALYSRGKLGEGERYVQESITGSQFEGSVRIVDGQIIPTIRGRAFITAEATLFFNPEDPLRWGILE